MILLPRYRKRFKRRPGQGIIRLDPKSPFHKYLKAAYFFHDKQILVNRVDGSTSTISGSVPIISTVCGLGASVTGTNGITTGYRFDDAIGEYTVVTGIIPASAPGTTPAKLVIRQEDNLVRMQWNHSNATYRGHAYFRNSSGVYDTADFNIPSDIAGKPTVLGVRAISGTEIVSFRDGEIQESNTSVGTFRSDTGNLILGGLPGDSADTEFFAVLFYEKGLPDHFICDLSHDPFLVTKARKSWIPVHIVSSGSDTVSPANAAHALTSGNVTLAQDHQIAVADSQHTLTSDAPALSQNHQIGAQDSQHTLVSGEPALSQDHQIAAADSQHALISSEAALTQDHQIAADDSQHALNSDNVTLSQGHTVSAADSQHALISDNATISQDHRIAADDSAHPVSSDTVALGQDHKIAVEDSQSALTSSEPTVRSTIADVISPNDCAHLLQSSSPIIYTYPYRRRSGTVRSTQIGWDAYNTMQTGYPPSSGERPIEYEWSDRTKWRTQDE